MPEQLTGELLALRDRAAQFAGWLANAQHRREVITAAREAGFLQMTQPRQYGGSAAGLLALTVVRDALASRNPPFLDAVFGPGPGVLAGCSEPLASDYLQPMLRGELRAAFGFTEPEENPTTGRLDADRLTVNGCKSYVTGGADADFINTLVRIDSMGPALVVIDSNAPGVHMTERFESLDGSHHAAFAFDGVVVPANRIIGKPGEGLPRAMGQIVDTRLAISANCVGWARWIVEHTTRHLETLDRNGKARGDRESVRLRYADMRMHTFAARSMLYRTARLAESGGNVINEGIMCKVFATEALSRVVDTAMQLEGGTALVVGHPLEALYRRVRALRLAEGASDVLRLNLARGALDLGKGTL